MTTTEAPRKPKWRASQRQYDCLTYIRDHPGVLTWDLVIGLQYHIDKLLGTLQTLVDRQLIGRQMPAPLPGHIESQWWPESTLDDAIQGWKPTKAKTPPVATGYCLCGHSELGHQKVSRESDERYCVYVSCGCEEYRSASA